MTKSINRLFLGMFLWAIAVPFFAGGFLRQLDPTTLQAAAQVLLALPVPVYLLIRRIRPQEWIPFRKIDIVTIFMSALAAFLLLPLVTFLNVFSMMFATNYVSQSMAQMTDTPFLVNLLVIAVLPAVFEELIYRGIFYHAYREKGVMIAAIASSIVFGVMHQNFNQFLYALVLGCVFCIMVEITGSIYASMTAHFTINGWSVLMLELQEPLQKMAGTQAETALTREALVAALAVYGLIAVIATTLAAGVLIWMTKHCKREPHMRWCFRKHPLPEGMKRSFLTPSFLAAVVVAAGYMILLG